VGAERSLHSPFHHKLYKLGKRDHEKRMIGNIRMPGKVVKVRILDWPMSFRRGVAGQASRLSHEQYRKGDNHDQHIEQRTAGSEHDAGADG
jgi:hypothetical protein